MDQYHTEIQELKDKLLLSEKRYELAMGFSDVTVFDYNVVTKKIQTQHTDFEIFGMPAVIENGVEDVIKSGIIAKRSHDDMRDLYKKIDAGEPSAKAIIYAVDVDGTEKILEIYLVNIFNEKSEPVYAVGVRKDITESLLLQKEKKYSDTIMSEWLFVFEANITLNRVTRYDTEWWSELNRERFSSFSDMVQAICETTIEPEFAELVKTTLSEKIILSSLAKRQNIISIEYRKKVQDRDYMWFKQSINIIKEEITDEIHIRVYIKNINDEKEKQQKAQEEQYYYESMVSKSDALYEFNITKDITIRGHDGLEVLLGTSKISNYSKMMELVCEKVVHPQDKEVFRQACFRDNILKAYQQKKLEIVCEYRKANLQGEFVWVRSTLHLFEEPISGDVKGYSYVHSIDEEKKQQLELIYKSQRDSLTDFYNKATLEDKVSGFLANSAPGTEKHAFLILDLDYFKAINDNFGHAFGDALLSQTAVRISSLFREDDILGRVGGDEFVVFMKNIQNENAVHTKAQELCYILSETYTQNGVEYHVSVSIGIAIFGKDGKTFQELYRNSDTALYCAKEHGRNQHAFYSNTMKFGATNIKAIDEENLLRSKTFKENISEYVFRILYESEDKPMAINTVLELIGKYFNASRTYIFENSSDGKYAQNTFEWCNKEVTAQSNNLQKIPYSMLGNYAENFNKDGYFFMADIEKASPSLRKILDPQGVKSMLQFSIMKNGKFVGFMGFDQCDRLRVATQNELSESRNMANVMGIFITEMRAIEEATASKQMALSVVNGLGSYAYVCNNRTHEILFINDRLRELLPKAEIDQICHKAFWARESVCENCPMEAMRKSGDSKYMTEMFNTNLKMWIKVTTSWIDWLGGERVCLVDSVDITKYMPKD